MSGEVSTLLEGVRSVDGDTICKGATGGTNEGLKLLLLEGVVSSIFPSGTFGVLEFE